MFSLNHEINIIVENLPIQWIPKIELYYPDLPQFPIMYIHCLYQDTRIVACPVAVSYKINDGNCNAEFLVLSNIAPTDEIKTVISNEIENRIGFSNRITKETILECCNGNNDYKTLLSDLWKYIEKSYGSSIPYGRFYEEIYSIPRFVAAWQPKTGRQSEMRMLYNFMSKYGEEAVFPNTWSHLEYYILPTYEDVRTRNYSCFPKFQKLYAAMVKIFNLDFTKAITIENKVFKVMKNAWPRNKDEFISEVSGRYYSEGYLSEEDKKSLEDLVDAFNRHPWRAAYFISALLTIEFYDYKEWNKDFFKQYYDLGSKLKGYSEKVVACFLQQGFAKEEIIPIDTWIETFYQFPLGITSRPQFYDDFCKLGKLERLIWLASQSNKTNMKNFFNILWCQRYGTIGNGELRGINPLSCSLCKLKDSCVGLKKSLNKTVYLTNNLSVEEIESDNFSSPNNADFICLLENDVPKKVCKKIYSHAAIKWILTDEFSGYLMTSDNRIPESTISHEIISLKDFVSLF